MNSPKYEDYMMPILYSMADKKTRINKEIQQILVKQMSLSEETMDERQKNGNLKYRDNINFALSYLSMASLLTKEGRGKFQISNLGLKLVDKKIVSINTNYLCELNPSFGERIKNKQKEKNDKKIEIFNKPSSDILNPYEKIEENIQIIKDSVSDSLINNILKSSPSFFEKIVVDLIKAMGFGVRGNVVGKSHDGGIDGIIYQDSLGLEKIYLQAKRYKDNTIGRPEVQKFAGSLVDSNKGILITTSAFTKEARDFATSYQKANIVLIDGDELVGYMYDFGVGVSTKETINVKEIDSDYFDEI